MKPRSVCDWNLDSKSKAIVNRELRKWVNFMAQQGDSRYDNVDNFDVLTKDIFFFTDCRDILGKTVESKAVESYLDIRCRKRAKYAALLLNQILNGPIHKKQKPCTHCGGDNRIIKGFSDLSGHFYYCPDCGKTDICTYPSAYKKLPENLQRELEKILNDKKEK